MSELEIRPRGIYVKEIEKANHRIYIPSRFRGKKLMLISGHKILFFPLLCERHEIIMSNKHNTLDIPAYMIGKKLLILGVYDE